jgi:hypothetical protein
MATKGHCDLVARVDVVVPVGSLEALHVEGPRLLAEPTCDLHTERHEHRAFARGEVPVVETGAPVAALVGLGHIRPLSRARSLGARPPPRLPNAPPPIGP